MVDEVGYLPVSTEESMIIKLKLAKPVTTRDKLSREHAKINGNQ